ncbi:MAG TPA: T9SS type A sorting domain-containing protein [Cytophagaceae bacterium]
MALSPNPAASVLTVTIPGNKLSDIMLVDTRGNTVMKTQSSDPKVELNVEDLENGLYTIVVYQGSKKIAKRVVINK